MFQSTRPGRARPFWMTRDSRTWSFNPRAREGRDLTSASVSQTLPLFQSTRPGRARRPSLQRLTVTRSFNPRAREGRDLSMKHLSRRK